MLLRIFFLGGRVVGAGIWNFGAGLVSLKVLSATFGRFQGRPFRTEEVCHC